MEMRRSPHNYIGGVVIVRVSKERRQNRIGVVDVNRLAADVT
jgi:hypothetical protein